MATQTVAASSAYNMIGPYLASEVTCPFCQHHNQLVHIEGYASPVKPVDVCRHIRAHIVDEDGGSSYQFDDAPRAVD